MKQAYLYPITIEECEEGGYFAACPLLQGCYAEGENIQEAVANLKSVIKIVLEYKRKHAKKFSPPVVMMDKNSLNELRIAVPT